jgi:hypothetical protein
MSVTTRTNSQTPNVVPKASSIDVTPAKIEMRQANPKSVTQKSSDDAEKNEQPSEDGYW